MRKTGKYVAGATTVNLEVGDAGADGRRPVSKIELIGRDGTKRAAYELVGSELLYEGETIADKVDGFFSRWPETQGLRKFDLEVITGDEVAGSQMTLRLVAPAIGTRVMPDSGPQGVVWNKTVDKYYGSIGEALGEAADGHEIRVMGDVGEYAPGKVHDGVFRENVEIRAGVTLKGGYDKTFEEEKRDIRQYITTIDGGVEDKGESAITAYLDSGKLKIDGFSIRGARRGAYWAGGAISVRFEYISTANGVTISNNDIHDNRAYTNSAIYIEVESAEDVEVVIDSNRIYENVDSWRGALIYVGGSFGARGKLDVQIENNLITNNKGAGMNLFLGSGEAEVNIVNNTILENIPAETIDQTRAGGMYIQRRPGDNYNISSNRIEGNTATDLPPKKWT